MLSLDETLRLNSEGAALFNADEPSAAVEKLHSSLLGARSLIHQTTPGGGNPNGPCLLHSDDESPRYGCSGKDKNGFFLFFRALTFKEPEEQGSTPELSVYCAGILFNLAIVHHKHGMKDGSSVLLDKATFFYRTVLEILQGNIGLQHHPTFLLLAFATHNNLVQIELENGVVENVNQRLQYMTRLLHAAQRTLLTAISESEVEGLFSNILIGAAGRLNAAAAA